MDWNLYHEAVAISAAFDGTLCIWNISHASKLDRVMKPMTKVKFKVESGLFVACVDV